MGNIKISKGDFEFRLHSPDTTIVLYTDPEDGLKYEIVLYTYSDVVSNVNLDANIAREPSEYDLLLLRYHVMAFDLKRMIRDLTNRYKEVRAHAIREYFDVIDFPQELKWNLRNISAKKVALKLKLKYLEKPTV